MRVTRKPRDANSRPRGLASRVRRRRGRTTVAEKIDKTIIIIVIPYTDDNVVMDIIYDRRTTSAVHTRDDVTCTDNNKRQIAFAVHPVSRYRRRRRYIITHRHARIPDPVARPAFALQRRREHTCESGVCFVYDLHKPPRRSGQN